MKKSSPSNRAWWRATWLPAALCLLAAGNAAEARPSPGWLRDGVIYQIFPRAYSPTGTFRGITADLDRLQKLGVNVLWLMPIHPIGKLKRKGTWGSPYAVRDYYAIDPDLGTAADLRQLVGEAHRRGLKVIIDMVANHTAWDSVLMKHPDWYTRDAAGHIQPPVPDWADVADLDYGNPALRRYMLDMFAYWIRDFDLDGLRCDVAGFVPTDFWEQARGELERIKPDLMMLAEAEQPDLLVKAFDIDYSWDLMHAVDAVYTGQQPASAIRKSWEHGAAVMPPGSLHMRITDDHDERRAIARLGERAALAGSMLMFTLDGVPLLYNGMEVGDTAESGAPALFEKLPIFWAEAARRPEFPATYRALIDLRHDHPALRDGEVIWLDNDASDQVLSFLRRDAGETLLVAINYSSRPAVARIDGLTPDFHEVAWNGAVPAAAGSAGTTATAGPNPRLDAWSMRLWRRDNK